MQCDRPPPHSQSDRDVWRDREPCLAFWVPEVRLTGMCELNDWPAGQDELLPSVKHSKDCHAPETKRSEHFFCDPERAKTRIPDQPISPMRIKPAIDLYLPTSEERSCFRDDGIQYLRYQGFRRRGSTIS